MLDSLRWLGIDWDEGPEVGGPFGPYRQSERFDIYRDIVARLRDAGAAYDCFCTTEEVEARRKASGSKVQGYDGHCRELTDEQRAGLRGRRPQPTSCGCGCPTRPIVFDDLVRGEVTFQPEHVPDFALVRANGDPLYTLVNPVDDALMGITHVLRGEDLLSSTPRQIALYEALAGLGVGTGVAAVRAPADRDGRGQQAALQARPRLGPARSTSSAASCPRAAQLPRPARLGDRRGPRRVHHGRRWPRPSTSGG